MRKTGTPLAITTTLASCLLLATACGPSCPEIKASLDEDTIMSEDVARVNAFVSKRKAAMAEAESGVKETFRLERLKFSVTAYEKAIEVQVKIIKISPKFDDSPKYEELKPLISDIRCSFDAIAEKPEHTVSDGEGKMARKYHAQIQSLLRKHVELTNGELEEYIEEGIGTD